LITLTGVKLLLTDIRDILKQVEVAIMEYQNITLSIPKDILKKVKYLAIERNTSVSGLLALHLKEIAARDDAYRRAKTRQLEMMTKGFDLIGRGKISWTGDDIHDRR
jgi:ATP-dependent protease Clp ATPase subunit